MNNLWNDLRFALRQLRRSPGFAITAILTLALGIGANTAIFSLLDQALLRSLPVQHPDELIVLGQTTKAWNGSSSSNGGEVTDYFSYPMYKDLRDQNKVFAGLIATTPAQAGFVHGTTSQVVNAELVSGNYFNVLGVQPALGRVFSQTDDGAPNANPLAVVSFDFWRNALASDPRIVGSKITLNGHPFEVIGVAAPRFYSAVWGQTPQVFVPMAMLDQVTGHTGNGLLDHKSRWLNILGRLAPGVSAAQAQAGMQPLWHGLREDELKNLGSVSPRFTAEFLTKSRLLVKPGARGFSYQRSSLEKPFLAVMAMAVLVLLISSVNVASLLLVRSASRIREFSLRAALGARTGRIVSQLLLEGTLIGIGGGLIGLAFAPIALRILVSRLSDPDNGTPFSAGIDGRILIFNFAVAIGVAILFSFAPVLQLRRLNITSTLRESSSTGSGSLLSLRRVVVCLQIGLSVILLVGAGLFLKTMQKLRAVDVGFNTTHLVTFDLDPTLAGYAPEAMPALHDRVLAALATIPGVRSVAATSDSELAGNHSTGNVSVFGYVAPPDDSIAVEQATVTPNYFETMQMPLIMGRALTYDDTTTHPLVTVVNQTFAKHFCGTPQNCIGRHMASGAGTSLKLDTEIVGVVRDARHGGLRDEIDPTWFRAIKQLPSTEGLSFYLRQFGDSAATITSVRRALHDVDPGLAPTGLRTMEEQIDRSLQNERMIALLAMAFGIIATLLAGIGLYGVLAYSTAQRTREIGVRMALGSTRLAISRLLVTDVLKLVALGVIVSLPIAYALSRLVRSQLFGVSGADPAVLIGVAGIIALVALCAAFIPARRAASINPTEALRTE